MSRSTTEAVLVGADRKVLLAEVELPAMSPTRVRVQTWLSGVSCGTESDCASGRAAYMKPPFITGYQAVGAVLEVGQDVASVKPGDVVITHGGGLWSMNNLAGGSHARESIAEARELVRFNGSASSYETASYAVLAAIAYEALSRFELQPGKILGVFGLGMLGQFAGSIGRTLGLRVIGINRSEWKGAIAKEIGFDSTCPPDLDAIRRAARALGKEAIDLALDTTGSQEIFDLALQALGRGGEVVLDGYYPDKFNVDFDLCHQKNLRIHNPVGPGNWLPDVVKLIENGSVKVESCVRHPSRADRGILPRPGRQPFRVPGRRHRLAHLAGIAHAPPVG